MHRWLRPGGLLVDLQPLGEPMTLHALAGESRTVLGRVHETAEAGEDMRLARTALARAMEQGLFQRRNEAVFTLEIRFPAESDWREFLERPKTGNVDADPVRIASAYHRGEMVMVLDPTTVTVCERGGGTGAATPARGVRR